MNRELLYAASELMAECPSPFVLDEDNPSHCVVRDCCGQEILSSHVKDETVLEQKLHFRTRLIARVLVALSKETF